MTISQILLVALLAIMSIGQLASWSSFVAAIASYAVWKPKPLAAVLVGGQTIAAVLVVIPSLRATGAAIAIAVAILWTVVAAIALVRKRSVPNCGCYGRFFSQPLKWHVLLQDVVFIALATWAHADAIS